jgi:epoxyqueuosine reductase QueG
MQTDGKEENAKAFITSVKAMGRKTRNLQADPNVNLENRLHDLATTQGADYFGIADLSPARETILEQGGEEIAAYPRSISIGIALFHPIVNQLFRPIERSAAVSYRSHCYDVINTRLDQIVSRLASTVQGHGYRVFPVPASKRIDDERICAIFSHKLSAHLAGLGWIGKNCLLITPEMGPRVRWATLLTDAPLATTGQATEQHCGECRECADICPVRAISGQPFHEEEPRSARFEAKKCDRYFRQMQKKDPETAVCGLCLKICPYGRKP